MSQAIIYAGTGKTYLCPGGGSIALQAEGENGPIAIEVEEETAEIATALFGRHGEQLVNQQAELTTKPFDDWGLISTLYPSFLGVGSAVVINSRPHGASLVPARVWTPDGRLYTFVRAAVVGHPSLHLGIAKGLFGDVRISCLTDRTVAFGAANCLFNTVTESAAAETAASAPGSVYAMAYPTGFVRESWTGVWGAIAGFGGAPSAVAGVGTQPIQAEDEWTIDVQAKYSPLKVQGRVVDMKLDSVNFMAKTKPVGPAHTDILARIGSHTQGQRLGSADLVLTSALSTKVITLKNAEVRGVGFKFGGTTLGTGEIAFVTGITFNAGAANPFITFSA